MGNKLAVFKKNGRVNESIPPQEITSKLFKGKPISQVQWAIYVYPPTAMADNWKKLANECAQAD